jgi:hypothetical protein
MRRTGFPDRAYGDCFLHFRAAQISCKNTFWKRRMPRNQEDLPNGSSNCRIFSPDFEHVWNGKNLNAIDELMSIDDSFTAGDNELARWTVTGTHEGELAGIPRTGRRFSVTGISIAHVANGKITESWNNWDALGLMQQLGVVSAEAEDRAA